MLDIGHPMKQPYYQQYQHAGSHQTGFSKGLISENFN